MSKKKSKFKTCWVYVDIFSTNLTEVKIFFKVRKKQRKTQQTQHKNYKLNKLMIRYSS